MKRPGAVNGGGAAGAAARRAAGRVMAFARFEALRTLGARGTLLGAGVLVLIHAVGRWQEAGSDGFFVLGFLTAHAVGFGPGLSTDRSLSFDRLLVLDLLAPWEYAAGKTAAMVAWVASVSAFAWATAVVFSAGDVRFAGWYTATLALLALATLPAVVVADLLLGIRLPAAVALLLGIVALVVLMALGIEPPTLLGALGLLVTPYSYASLEPLALRACLALAATPVLVGVAAGRRGWRARGGARGGGTGYLPPSPG